MSFFDKVATRLNAIQRITTRYCPKCKKEMYLARWMGMWTCIDCDITIDFTKEERKLVNRFERERRLTRTKNIK